jgi:hypothetical protein
MKASALLHYCITAEIQCSTAYCVVSKLLFGKSNASASLCVFLSCAMMPYSIPFGFKMEEIFGAFRLPLPLPTASEKVVCSNNAWQVEHFPRNCQKNCQEKKETRVSAGHLQVTVLGPSLSMQHRRSMVYMRTIETLRVCVQGRVAGSHMTRFLERPLSLSLEIPFTATQGT